jgi:hypothetical protein
MGTKHTESIELNTVITKMKEINLIVSKKRVYMIITFNFIKKEIIFLQSLVYLAHLCRIFFLKS